MAADEPRESEALEWGESLIDDVADEPGEECRRRGKSD